MANLDHSKQADPHRVLKQIESLTDFIETVRKQKARTNDTVVFRGQRKSAWFAKPSLRHSGAKLARYEKQAVRDMISTQPDEFSADETMFDRLVRMQHFGLPTRLMDVSLNPLVGLFFATQPPPEGEADSDGKVWMYRVPETRLKYYDSDAVSCISNLANLTSAEKRLIRGLDRDDFRAFNAAPVIGRLVQFIKAEKPYFLREIVPTDLFKPYFVIPKMNNSRLIAQSGRFIIHGLLRPLNLKVTDSIDHRTIVIPQALKAPLRAQLADLSIHEYALYPDLERAARNVKQKWG